MEMPEYEEYLITLGEMGFLCSIATVKATI